MYAVIETGGKQYRVEVGTELEVELLDIEPGAAMKIERVLLVADGDTAAIGRPIVENASVAATVVGRDRGDKVVSFKYRPKARRRVKKGHRQELTLLRISDIVLDGHSAAEDAKAAEEARQRDRSKLEEAARRQASADAELAAKLAAEKPAEKPTSKASEKGAKAEAPKSRAGRGSAKTGTETSKAEGSGAAKAGTKASPASKASASKASGARASASKASGAKASGTESRKTQAGGAKPAAKPAPKAPAKPRTKKES